LIACLAWGCSSGSMGDSAPTRGTLGGVCYGNDTCNDGLSCVSKTCVAASDSSVSDTASGPIDTAPLSDAPLTFEGDIIPIFESSCGSRDNECHSRVAFHPKPESGCRGWLSLENVPLGSKNPMDGTPTGCPDMALYDRLTKLDSWECGDPYFPMFPKKKYIAAKSPSASHLLNKMNGGAQCGVTNAMPKGGTAKASDIDKITRWINAGAPR
jgi:hypothetical protein